MRVTLQRCTIVQSLLDSVQLCEFLGSVSRFSSVVRHLHNGNPKQRNCHDLELPLRQCKTRERQKRPNEDTTAGNVFSSVPKEETSGFHAKPVVRVSFGAL